MVKTKISTAHFVKIAWRHFIKDRLFTVLNLAGLSTGLAAVLFIFLWVKDERSIDRFHANDNRLYQVLGSISLVTGVFTQDFTPGILAQSMAADLPEVEAATGVLPIWGGPVVLTVGDKSIKAIADYIDGSFFNVFSFPIVAGSSRILFENKQTVLLSDETASKLFGSSTNSIGKTIQWLDEPSAFVVAGVFKKPPVNSTLQFDVLFNIKLRADRTPGEFYDWNNSNPSTYLLLKKGTDLNAFNKKIYGYEQTKSKNAPLSLQATRFSDHYLYNKYENAHQAGGRIEYVRLFSLIAFFILLIACINFMNLSTAKAARRFKEIGIKKVAGASRLSLITQYIGESMLIVFLSVLLAVCIVWLLLPQFNGITGKSLNLSWNLEFVSSLLAITIITGLIAGSYPAFYLSRFKPATVLKGHLPASLAELWMRKGLVVFQFSLSVIFIIGVITIHKQMGLVQKINLGYEKDNIITFRNEGPVKKSIESFLSDLKNIPGVVNAATVGGSMTGSMSGMTEKLSWEGKQPGDTAMCKALDVDYGLLEMLGIKMAQGRTFSREMGMDSLTMILNEQAVATMNMKNPVGKTVTVWGHTYRVIGVAKDFHYESLYEKVKPCFIRYMPGNYNIFVKINGRRQQEILMEIGKIYRSYNPKIPFSFTFLDENYQAMYVSEQRVTALSHFFAGLAIIISCLGLFGLAAFTAEKRKKEIGIRKVIGASVSNVIVLLSSDFLKLVLIAALIAFPLAWWAMNEWLKSFAYRVHLNAGMFVTASLSILLITLLTVSIQSIKAAIANPVKALRSE